MRKFFWALSSDRKKTQKESRNEPVIFERKNCLPWDPFPVCHFQYPSFLYISVFSVLTTCSLSILSSLRTMNCESRPWIYSLSIRFPPTHKNYSSEQTEWPLLIFYCVQDMISGIFFWNTSVGVSFSTISSAKDDSCRRKPGNSSDK